MFTRRRLLGAAASLPIFGLMGRPAFATPEVYSDGGLALGGADPVAYFAQGQMVQGSVDYTLMWRGTTWRFATMDARSTFEMNPEAYAPQFGGYCAYALSQGALAPTVPEAWTVFEGKLYMTYSVDVRGLWRQDIPGNLAKAEPYWPAIARS
mgnify:CR=1 FL=1